MDAMSDAIEGADVMLYGESLRYKESANVSASGCVGLLLIGSFAYLCVGRDIVRRILSVSIGGELRPSAGAGHDPADDGQRLQAAGLA